MFFIFKRKFKKKNNFPDSLNEMIDENLITKTEFISRENCGENLEFYASLFSINNKEFIFFNIQNMLIQLK